MQRSAGRCRPRRLAPGALAQEGHPFRGLTNLVMTPHMGGSTDAALDSVALVAVEHALAVLNGLPIDRAVCVNPVVLKN